MQEKYCKRSGTKRSEPRASTTDPEARRMKMGDGGTRPAMNVQFASDGGLMQPMYDDVCTRYDVVPDDDLVDGGFVKKDDITHVEQQGTQVFAPLLYAEQKQHAEQKQLPAGEDPYALRPGERAEMTAHRRRMGTTAAKEKYKRRAPIAEFSNADCRNRGLSQFRVRRLAKAKAHTLWHVLAYNFMRLRNLVCPLRVELSGGRHGKLSITPIGRNRETTASPGVLPRRTWSRPNFGEGPISKLRKRTR